MLWSFKMENGEGESVTSETVCHGGKRCDPRIELQLGHSCSTSLTTWISCWPIIQRQWTNLIMMKLIWYVYCDDWKNQFLIKKSGSQFLVQNLRFGSRHRVGCKSVFFRLFIVIVPEKILILFFTFYRSWNLHESWLRMSSLTTWINLRACYLSKYRIIPVLIHHHVSKRIKQLNDIKIRLDRIEVFLKDCEKVCLQGFFSCLL